jgi:hypothetical protein
MFMCTPVALLAAEGGREGLGAAVTSFREQAASLRAVRDRADAAELMVDERPFEYLERWWREEGGMRGF